MVGAATSRRAGLGSAATALALAIAVGACGGQARQAQRHEREHVGARAAAAEPKPVAVWLPRLRGGVPSPVVLRTAAGAYVIARSGAIRALRSAKRPRVQVRHPAGFIWLNRSAGTWATMRQGHLVIMRNRAVIWQSTARYAVRDAAHLAGVVVGRRGVAFQVHLLGPWLIAMWHHPEHVAGTGGWPEMWTRSGNLIVVLHRRGSRNFGFAVYSPSGIRLTTLATGLRNYRAGQRVDDLATGMFWYLNRDGNLIRTDGVATRLVASTRALGLTGTPGVGIVGGGLIQFLSVGWRQGQVILYPGGRLFARIPAPPKLTGGFGGLSVSPGRRMVAYVVTSERANRSTVFLVRPGRTPVAVYRTAHGSSPCGPVPLAWHGSWLLYTPRGGAVLIDTAHRHHVIRLPARLPGSDGRPMRVQSVSWR